MDVDCATEVWVATALLHRERPDAVGFKLQELVDKAYGLGFAASRRAGTVLHATQHAVASKPASPSTYRYLTIAEGNMRRLFREGDPAHPSRHDGKIRPDADEIPEEYRELVEWYEDEYVGKRPAEAHHSL